MSCELEGLSASTTAIPPAQLVLKMPSFHAFVDYQEHVRGVIVPQEVFFARGQSNWEPLHSIQFRVNGTLGVRLQDALRYSSTHEIRGLDNPNDLPILSNTSIRVTMRIQWPGYESWTDANGIHQYDHGYAVNLRNRQHIAWQVARSVKTFYDEMHATQGREPGWTLNQSRSAIAFGDLYLVELRNVSRGSWQPVLSWLPASGTQ